MVSAGAQAYMGVSGVAPRPLESRGKAPRGGSEALWSWRHFDIWDTCYAVNAWLIDRMIDCYFTPHQQSVINTNSFSAN